MGRSLEVYIKREKKDNDKKKKLSCHCTHVSCHEKWLFDSWAVSVCMCIEFVRKFVSIKHMMDFY